MNVLLLSLYKFNSLEDGYIYCDLISEFKNDNHNVYAINPLGDLTCQSELITENECNIVRVKTGSINKNGPIQKVINLLLLEKNIIKAIKKHSKKVQFDLVVVMVSNLSFYKTVKYMKKRDNTYTYMLLKDIFPQNAVDMQMIKKDGIIYKYFNKKEKKYYKLVDKIGCISDKNVELLKRINIKFSNKFEYNPNSIQVREIILSDDDALNIQKRYNIARDKKIILYGGNLGKPQGIDFLIEVICENRNNDNIFLIIGSGTEYKRIEEAIKNNNISNCFIYPSVPQSVFKKICLMCDIGLVFLDKRFTVPNYPSRILTYMETKLPMIFAVDEVCDAADIAVDNGFGLKCINGDLKTFFSHLSGLCKDEKRREEMGQNAFEFLERNYSTKVTYDIIMKN